MRDSIHRRLSRSLAGVLAASLVLASTACSRAADEDPACERAGGGDVCPTEERTAVTQGPGGSGGEDPVIAGAGDIACAPGEAVTPRRCHQMATSDLLVRLQPAAVFALGDNQYPGGARSDFERSYGPSWGRLKSVTRPTPGNAEYATPGARDYFGYFGAAAGSPGKGYYAYGLGSWRVLALNGNCPSVGGCSAGSPQGRWLAAELESHPSQCALAYWHQAGQSSKTSPSQTRFSAFWSLLHEHGAEVVVNAHQHRYERFAPRDPNGTVDRERGMRQFIVGTGGASLFRFQSVQPASEARNDRTFGVLALTLHPHGYDWRFIPEAGGTFTDSGTGFCH